MTSDKKRHIKDYPSVSLAVINWERPHLTKTCLTSLKSLDYPSTQLDFMVIDNNSSDESVKLIRADFPDIPIHVNTENNYAKALNLAIKKAKGEFIGFLNNDVIIEQNWLKESISAIQSRENAGAVGGKIMFDDKKTIQSTGHKQLENFYWVDRGFNEKDTGQYNKLEEIKSLCGAAIIYRKKCFDETGLFDENFGMYLEDVDFAFRCSQKGWKLLYAPEAVAYHKFRGTIENNTVVRTKIERNRLFVIAKHFPEQFADCIFESRFFLTESPDIIETDLPIIFNTWTESCASKKCKTASPSDLAVKARKFLERQIRLCQNYEQELLHKDQAIVEMKHRAIEKEQALIEIKHLMVNKESELAEKNIEILLAKKEMEKIRNTRSWKILSALYNLRKKIGLTS